MSFSQFNFDSRIAAGITACQYGVPTPIQAQAIPPALAGHDVMGLAQTGTGKTAAFALPIMQRLLNGPRRDVRALVLAPTRELAEQIRSSFRDLGSKTGLSSVSIYGGANMNNQIHALRRVADIVVACPGRLLDLINRRSIDLSKVEVLVLDEADMMLDMGFLPDIRRVLSHLPQQRQNMMFSATMPAEIRSLAGSILKNPVTVQISSSAPVETVSHALYPVAQTLKTPLLMELLKKMDVESVLVFTRTKHRAKKVGAQLAKAGHRATSLQGNLSQNARDAALSGFRSGKFDILVATDIAARGIDVSQVSHVINYDIPDTTAAYTHRIGRTGRALRTGDAFTFVTHEDHDMVRDIERVLGAAIERRNLEGFDYNQAGVRQSEEFSREPRPARKSSQPKAQRSRNTVGAPAVRQRFPEKPRRSRDERGGSRDDRSGNRSERGRSRNGAPRSQARPTTSQPSRTFSAGQAGRDNSAYGTTRNQDRAGTTRSARPSFRPRREDPVRASEKSFSQPRPQPAPTPAWEQHAPRPVQRQASHRPHHDELVEDLIN
ncbi:MAG: DEAD/DEAH box helicase [Candidatus Sumerlaeaceae bacterium]|nr:DEAD/DEAH box helicase [Candidatus Sumerlaeaceae bacterium]